MLKENYNSNFFDNKTKTWLCDELTYSQSKAEVKDLAMARSNTRSIASGIVHV